MKIACLSGKGGAGKTLVAVNLIAAAAEGTYIDCDVEEPNGRLFLKPEKTQTEIVSTLLPEFDAEKCTGCKQCVEFCRFHALMYIKEKPMVFSETYALIAERDVCGVLDIGGDDRGALALGRYVPEIRAEGDYEMLFVINRARPLTRTVADTILVLREIEAACGLPFTAVVNNTNLGQATAANGCGTMPTAT